MEIKQLNNVQVLTRAHEREFGSIDEKNKPIWQVGAKANSPRKQI